MIRITIEIDDSGKVSIDQDDKKKSEPFILTDDVAESLPNRPVYQHERTEDITAEQANRFANQFANDLSKSPVHGQEMSVLADRAALDAVDKAVETMNKVDNG